MWSKFKWDMFVTSFIPLWISIVIADIWDIGKYIIIRWHYLYSPHFDIGGAIRRFLKANMLMVISIIIIIFIVSISITEINKFIREKEKDKAPPIGSLVKVSRANKLSAEFLLAYILPMIAFDFSQGKSVLLFAMYFGVLAYLCIRNNNVYTNIYLEIKNYRMYECDVKCKVANSEKVYQKSLVISRRNLITRINSDMKYCDFDNYIYIDLEKE